MLREDDYKQRFLELKFLQTPGISIVSVSLIIMMMTSHMTLLTLRRVVTTAQLCSLWLHHISSLTALAATAPTTTVTAVTAAESSCWGQKMLLLLVRVKMSLRRWRNRFLATLSLILLTTLLTLHHTLHAMLGIFGWCKPISTSQIFTPTTSLVTTQQIYKCELKYFE